MIHQHSKVMYIKRNFFALIYLCIQSICQIEIEKKTICKVHLALKCPLLYLISTQWRQRTHGKSKSARLQKYKKYIAQKQQIQYKSQQLII